MPLSSADSDATANEIAPQVRSLQIIHAALMAGVAAYFVFVVSQGLRFSEDSNALPLIPLGVAAMSVVMSVVVPPIVRRAGDPSPVSVPALMRELGNSPRGVSEGGA